MSKKRLIHAVHERDLDEFLENAGILVDLEDNRLTCARCGVKIDRDNISRFVFQENRVLIFCIQPHCLELEGVKNNSD